MAGKKLPKDIDIAAGFFSAPASNEESSVDAVTEKITAPAATKKKTPPKAEQPETKNVGGRPRKDGLKNEQFTLTMNPEIYEKLRIVANEHTRGNFSGLIDEAIKAFCRERNIDLAAIEVEPQILDIYRQRQAKKSSKK
jgi:hypothetical protein